MPRGYGNSARNNGQWRTFGNSGTTSSFERNRPGFSSFGAISARASNLRSPGQGVESNRFSTSLLPSTRFTSFSSFSSGRSMSNFGGARFGGSGFGSSDFRSSGFGNAGFFNSGIGSGASLIPNLFGDLFNLGTSFIGGRAILAANALSLAVRLFVSAIGATGFGQGGSASGDIGFGQGGFNGNFGLEAAPVWPACSTAPPFGELAPASGVFCGPNLYQPSGWGSASYVGGPRPGFSYP